jgi:hypothetical protein
MSTFLCGLTSVVVVFFVVYLVFFPFGNFFMDRHFGYEIKSSFLKRDLADRVIYRSAATLLAVLLTLVLGGAGTASFFLLKGVGESVCQWLTSF